MVIDRGAEGTTLADDPHFGWHLARLDGEFADRHVTVTLVARPLPGCSTALVVHHHGGHGIVALGASAETDGHLAHGAWPHVASVATDPAGRLVLEASFNAYHHDLLIGTCRDVADGRFAGTGQAQWEILDLRVTTRERQPMAREDRIVIVDVGAAGSIGDVWPPVSERIYSVLIEPDADAAADLRGRIRSADVVEVHEVGLSDWSGPQTLFVTRYPPCSSLLEPDFEQLRRFAVAPCFEVVKRVEVTCTRYDELAGAPPPDLIKIDVQGMEYQVLQGFGAHLDRVLAIELEAHFYPIYKGQRLLHELVDFLAGRGLRLRRMEPQRNFDSEYLEVNCWFTRDGALSPSQAEKMRYLDRALNIEWFDGGQRLAEALTR